MPNITVPTFLGAIGVGDAISNADPNTLSAADLQIHNNMRALIETGGSNTYNDTINNIDARVAVLEAIALEYMTNVTDHAGGFWGDIVWKDADEIVIKVKGSDGITPFIGARLNDGTFLYLTSDATVKYDIPANSGHILDGITAKLNNEWQILWAYEDSGGALAFGLTWQPQTTVDAANPAGTVTLKAVNAQDTGYLWPVGAHIGLFQDRNEWELPIFASIDGGAVTYDGTADKPKIASRTTTVLTLGANLTNATFTVATVVFVRDGFQPLAIDDGLIVDVIGARGYKDTGFRLMSSGAGAVRQFRYNGREFRFTNGSGVADYTSITGVESNATDGNKQEFYLVYSPADKVPIVQVYAAGGETHIPYAPECAYGEANVATSGDDWHVTNGCGRVISASEAGGATNMQTRGWAHEK